MALLAGRATKEGTGDHAMMHGIPHREWDGLHVSSLGHGSYLGEPTPEASQGYQDAILACLHGGVNVIDTASNYREQRSERDVGQALRTWIDQGGDRDQVVVSSKAGFLHGDADSPLGPDWFTKEYVLSGVLNPKEVVKDQHCLSRRYIRHELVRSQDNLGLETIDVYFLHNPESQLAAGVDKETWMERMRVAFHELETAADEGRIQYYGVATWAGFRVDPESPAHMDLAELWGLARQAKQELSGDPDAHRFRAIQLPLNVTMTEGLTNPNQSGAPVLERARQLGLLVMGSASLAQGRLAGKLDAWKAACKMEDDVEAALAYARGTGAVPLVGMGTAEHAMRNVQWAHAPLPDLQALA